MQVINIEGDHLGNMIIENDAFDYVGDACTERFRDSYLEECLKVTVVVDGEEKPIGYCSYWTEYNLHPYKNEITVLYFQIDYVYLASNYRGKKISSKLAEITADRIVASNRGSVNVRQAVDNSQYVSQDGCNFGNSLYRNLNTRGIEVV
ncbi:hypothetical protein VCRA2113O324_350011 [Vibrio crassostreae]|nr:hypothetical protein VCRA2113O324_350011 [Vibrio crassostreae]CAK2058126.1 hypothetical protein VCRA2111O320_350007 [Vibrio crassostreae]CAK2912670.1 hypothetical protein VCRA2121O336_340014 [Vibrio crassostreae]CAK3429039.1 hypothetical protein VCRA2120O329_340011 [Vibrio crassostreae]CAK3938808.1 hypothetical protein VCRA2128O347_370010 [Vibrio crassostreae]